MTEIQMWVGPRTKWDNSKVAEREKEREARQGKVGT